MKSLRSILTSVTGLLTTLCLASCGASDKTAPTTVKEFFTVLMVVSEENQSLLIGGKEDGSGEAATVSLEGLTITGSDGKDFPFSDLQPGHILSVTWDGYILETYPAQLQHISSVSIAGEQPAEWVNPIDDDPFFDSWREPSGNQESIYGKMPVLQLEYTLTAKGAAEESASVCCMNIAKGTSSWYSDGEGICVDSLHPLEWEEDTIPVLHRDTSLEVRLLFSQEPDSAIVRRWDWSQWGDITAVEDCEEDTLTEDTLSIPAKGEYLYEITAQWEEGTVTYVFSVR